MANRGLWTQLEPTAEPSARWANGCAGESNRRSQLMRVNDGAPGGGTNAVPKSRVLPQDLWREHHGADARERGAYLALGQSLPATLLASSL